MPEDSYFNGCIESIAFELTGTDFEVVILEPGDYDFPAMHLERIGLLRGELIDRHNGMHYQSEAEYIRYLPRYQSDDRVEITCIVRSACLCWYRKRPCAV